VDTLILKARPGRFALGRWRASPASRARPLQP